MRIGYATLVPIIPAKGWPRQVFRVSDFPAKRQLHPAGNEYLPKRKNCHWENPRQRWAYTGPKPGAKKGNPLLSLTGQEDLIHADQS